MTYDDAHTRNIADAVAAFTDPAAETHVRAKCGWCDGIGSVPAWSGRQRVGDVACARCAGRGSVLVESGSCND